MNGRRADKGGRTLRQAPEEVVEEQRDRRDELVQLRDKTEAARGRLAG